MKKLNTLPVTIDTEAIALGMLDMFDEDELEVLRFGMLPAEKMEVLERSLREKFETMAVQEKGDMYNSVIWGENGEVRIVGFDMKELVKEAMREVTLALYRHGDLVV